MENKDMVNLLEKSILPLMAEMIKAMGEHSHRYENHIKDIKEKVINLESSVQEDNTTQQELLNGIQVISDDTKKLTNRENNQEEVLTILTKTISTFGEKLTTLIDTNNRLIDHQNAQSNRMDDVIYAFEENTARLNTLTLAVRDNERDILEDGLFPKENQIFEEISNQGERKPIHEVLEDEISKLKGDK